MANFQVGLSYNFDVYPAAVLGGDFSNLTVQAVVDSSFAANYIDIVASHKQTYGYLPPGTPDDPTSYNYVLFKTKTNSTIVLGLPWIKDSTVVEINNFNATLIIRDITSGDIPKIRDALVSNGFNNFEWL